MDLASTDEDGAPFSLSIGHVVAWLDKPLIVILLLAVLFPVGDCC